MQKGSVAMSSTAKSQRPRGRNTGKLLLPEVVAALRELKTALIELYGERLRGVYLYGSYARGDYHVDSDVDVLVALNGIINTGR